MHVLIKRSAELMLERSGLLRMARSRHGARTLVLAYHNIVPAGERATGDVSLHLNQSAFAAQLDILAETHDVVALSDVFTQAARADRPRAVITFDDAYRGALTAGLEELRQRGLPATVFVAPEFAGGESFWWDELAGARGSALPDAIRRYAIEQLNGDRAIVREWAAASGFPAVVLPAHQTGASEAELRAAEASGLVQLASHSWSHRNLCRLNDAQLEQELNDSLHWLQQRFHAVLPWLSYPYGLSSSDVERETARAGYTAACVIDGGWLPRSTAAARYRLPRANVPSGISGAGFRILASGLRPLRVQAAQRVAP